MAIDLTKDILLKIVKVEILPKKNKNYTNLNFTGTNFYFGNVNVIFIYMNSHFFEFIYKTIFTFIKI